MRLDLSGCEPVFYPQRYWQQCLCINGACFKTADVFCRSRTTQTAPSRCPRVQFAHGGKVTVYNTALQPFQFVHSQRSANYEYRLDSVRARRSSASNLHAVEPHCWPSLGGEGWLTVGGAVHIGLIKQRQSFASRQQLSVSNALHQGLPPCTQTVVTAGNWDNPWPTSQSLCGGKTPDVGSKMFVGLSPYATWTILVDPLGSTGEEPGQLVASVPLNITPWQLLRGTHRFEFNGRALQATAASWPCPPSRGRLFKGHCHRDWHEDSQPGSARIRR